MYIGETICSRRCVLMASIASLTLTGGCVSDARDEALRISVINYTSNTHQVHLMISSSDDEIISQSLKIGPETDRGPELEESIVYLQKRMTKKEITAGISLDGGDTQSYDFRWDCSKEKYGGNIIFRIKAKDVIKADFSCFLTDNY